MLVLTRRLGEIIKIGDDITVIVTNIKNNLVQIGIEAPKDVPVHRGEIYERIQKQNREAPG